MADQSAGQVVTLTPEQAQAVGHVVKLQSAQPTALQLAGRGAPVRTVLSQIDREQQQRAAEGADVLPTVGGAIGGIFGGIPGATFGGAVGSAAKQDILSATGRKPLGSPAAQAKELGTSAAIQGGLETGGRLIQGALRLIAPRLYQHILKPTIEARREYQDLVATGLKHGIPITESGAERAAQMVADSRNAADRLVQNAEQANPAARIEPRNAVAGGLAPVVGRLRNLGVSRPALKAAGDYARDFIAEHPLPFTLSQAQAFVRAEDRALDPAFRAALDRGDLPQAGRTAAELGITKETRGLLRDAVPGLREQNANTRSLAGLQQAVERRAGQLANNSPVGMQDLINLGVGTAVGAGSHNQRRGAETFGALELLLSPLLGGRQAIAVDRLSRVPFSQALRAAVLARLGQRSGTPSGQ